MIKKWFLLFVLMMTNVVVFACTACEKQQPKALKGITHGSGPDSQWDYVIIIAMGIIVVLTLWYSMKMLIWPGEKSKEHIKRTVLKNN